MTKYYPVIIELDPEGAYIVTCPSFRGCRSYGRTIDEALSNIQEAIELCRQEEEDQNGSETKFVGFRDVAVNCA